MRAEQSCSLSRMPIRSSGTSRLSQTAGEACASSFDPSLFHRTRCALARRCCRACPPKPQAHTLRTLHPNHCSARLKTGASGAPQPCVGEGSILTIKKRVDTSAGGYGGCHVSIVKLYTSLSGVHPCISVYSTIHLSCLLNNKL